MKKIISEDFDDTVKYGLAMEQGAKEVNEIRGNTVRKEDERVAAQSEHCNPKTPKSKDLRAQHAQEPPTTLKNVLEKRLNVMGAGSVDISRVQQLAEHREGQNIKQERWTRTNQSCHRRSRK